MKKIVTFFLSAVFFLLILPAQAKEHPFNGYIIKYKSGEKVNVLPEGATLHATVIGHFVHVKNLAEVDLFLEDSSSIQYVEPNYIYKIANSKKQIDDSRYKKQWALKNTGKNAGGWFSRGTLGEDINAEEAWTITTGIESIKIAVIDTGIDYSHPDLKGNILTNSAELNGIEGLDDDGNGFVDDIYGYDFANNDGDPMDGHGHGTHCAGVIGAKHNSIGIRGVMSNVKLIPIKFFTDSGRGELIGAIKSIDYAIKRGAHIMSNSWGGGPKTHALEEVIEAARDANILFIVAAGNDGKNIDDSPVFPAGYDIENIITVGASDGKGKRASFSNFGKKTVDLFAPGVGIYSTVHKGKYKKFSGTSMATPIVSGVVGLMLSEDSSLDYQSIKEKLMNSAVQNGPLSGMSMSGRVDAYQALLQVGGRTHDE